MKLTAPTKPMWIIALVLGLLGIAGHFTSIPLATPNQFWFVAVAWLILVLATALKGI